jgi:nucleotide-binding universal stress UspA family protein
VMGTHGASGFSELFIGSNAHKVVSVCPCPVITIQTNSKKAGFSDIVLPIDDSLHSRQKVDNAIVLAKKFAAKIHILGLLQDGESADMNKFGIKLESIEKLISKNGIQYECEVVRGKNLAVETLKYANKKNADLIIVMSDHESDLTGRFMGNFNKLIVNHSTTPVMSIRAIEGYYDFVSLSATNPF